MQCVNVSFIKRLECQSGLKLLKECKSGLELLNECKSGLKLLNECKSRLELLNEHPLLCMQHALQPEVQQAFAKCILLPTQNRKVKINRAGPRKQGRNHTTELHQVRESTTE